MVRNLGYLHRVGNEIQALQSRLKAISESTSTYGIQKLGDNETNQSMIQHPQRNRHPHVEDDVVGFEKHTETLLTELMKDDEDRRVVSIIGVGGLGKTTLAKKVYRHDRIKSRFDCRGWSSVSQQLNEGDVWREVMRCMSLPNEGNPMEKLYNYLQDKRYFVVLDDVWEVDHWTKLKTAFPSGKRGSKVLLTTRKKLVASWADPFSLHLEPLFLNDEQSWELLCRNAFPKDIVKAGCYPTDLERLGRKMVRKCGGLPLAICVLGGLLATKSSDIKQWELVHNNVNSYINKGENGGVNGIIGILALSYHDLPSHLKPCFLYLGLFPEDYAIPRKMLIQLWIAEGFITHIQENMEETLEDTGEHQYLAQLIQRCMIQLDKGISGSKYCRVHDLMRDLCLSKAKEINFLNIQTLQHDSSGSGFDHIQPSDRVTLDLGRRVRRHAIHLNNSHRTERYENYVGRSNSSLRTLLVINPPPISDFPLAPVNFENLRLLIVLDVGNKGPTLNPNISKVVSKLIHLRYLDLGYLYGDCPVSSSTGNLRNLQFLRCIHYGKSLPHTISKLVQLRHLHLWSVDSKFRIEDLINLQTLDGIEAGKWIRNGCFERFVNLRKLSVSGTSRLQTDIILKELVGKPSLLLSPSLPDNYQCPIRNLSIRTVERFPNFIFESLSHCQNLHTLKLSGGIDDDVNLQNFPQNLTKIYFTDHFIITEDLMAAVENLPKLKTLFLGRCIYDGGEEIVFSSNGFPQLQHLSLSELENVKELKVEQGGMPQLKTLYMDYCSKLSMIPEGLRFITNLEKLSISNMPLITKRVEEGGEDWYKVQHIPSISCHNHINS